MEHTLTFSLRLVAICIVTLSVCNLYAAEKSPFKVGESLQKENPATVAPNIAYKNLNWDELSPADWDPLAALKGLELDKLEDSDPRARDALIAVGEAWKSAPIIPALNGQRVRIAGFVVPLDIDKNKVKEFLLVPYFGACIHVPPPPSNQAIHAINATNNHPQQNKILKDAALIQGPVTIIGKMRTMLTNTSLGSAGYKIQIESIEAYKEVVNN